MGIKTIHKYKLQPEVTIDMPEGAEILGAAWINSGPVMWALVDPEADAVQRRHFVAKCTGEAIEPDGLKYVGTILRDGGHMVFHIFEKV